ncbi:MAG: histidinol dehydrogenase [Armatimonadetes bacterium]|nr:histidinol dehydrogenase [Armatimonadota bacterium]
MKLIRTAQTPTEEIQRLLAPSPLTGNREVEEAVRVILEDVRLRGDRAVLDYTHRFDCPGLKTLKASPSEIEAACGQVSGAFLDAMRAAKANIETFHRQQLRASWMMAEDGVVLGQIIRPIGRAGFYVPGGKAPYPSTVLMVAVPAKVAGVGQVALCTPPGRDGQIDPHTLAAARECGVEEIYKIGGAQAVGAMAFGTESVPKVDKIVGPGNLYVVTAKRLLFGRVGIEMLPGPSEIMIVADESAPPRYIAADLLSQAEHGSDSVILLATPSETLAKKVLEEIASLRAGLSREKAIAASLESAGAILITRSLEEACDLVNRAAPEHVELAVADPYVLLGRIRNAGAILLGYHSPVPLGDYFAGPSHTLPTGGTARFSSPLHVDDFLTKSSILSYSKERLLACVDQVETLAMAEGFDAHALSLKVRRDG